MKVSRSTTVLFHRHQRTALSRSVKTCTRCGVAKPLDEFPPVRRGQAKRQTWCRACFAKANARNYQHDRERQKARLVRNKAIRRAENQANVIAYLREHPCVDCCEGDILVLEFDHLREKVEDLAAYVSSGSSWKRVLAEISKCEVRCANCHRRRTAERVAAARRPRPPSSNSRRPAIQLHLSSAVATRICRVCDSALPLTDFPFRSVAANTHHWICLGCQRSWANLWYRRRIGHAARPMRTRRSAMRAELANTVFVYLSAHPCADCGEADPLVLDFDHAGHKRANVSDLVISRASITAVMAEIGKCEVRCVNCHRRKTARAGGWYRTRAMSEPCDPGGATREVCDPGGNRTLDFLLRRQALYPLSYRVMNGPDSTGRWAARPAPSSAATPHAPTCAKARATRAAPVREPSRTDPP